MNEVNHYEVKTGIKPVIKEGYSQVLLYSDSLTSLLHGTKTEGDCFIHGAKETSVSLPGRWTNIRTELIHDGKEYLFDPARLWTVCKTYCNVEERTGEIHWHIIRMTLTGLIEVQVTAQKKNMRPVNLPDSAAAESGKTSYYMNCSNAIGSIEICKKNIWGEKVTVDRIFMDDVYCLYEIK